MIQRLPEKFIVTQLVKKKIPTLL